MLRNQQNLGQRLQQGLQQKLSPQQLQYIKLLQLTTQGLEQRIKEELETNPILEQVQSEEDWESSDQEPLESSSLDSPEIDFSDGMTQSSENGLESLEEQRWIGIPSRTIRNMTVKVIRMLTQDKKSLVICRIRIILPC